MHAESSSLSTSIEDALPPAWCATGSEGRPTPRKHLVISLEPPSPSIAVGESLEVGLRVSGLRTVTAPALGAFEVSLSYNPRLLAFDRAIFADPGTRSPLGPIAGATTGSSAYPETGTIHAFGISLDSPEDLEKHQKGSLVLARFRFVAVSAGVCQLNPFVVELSDPRGAPLRIDWTRGLTLAAVASPAILAGSGLFRFPFAPGLLPALG